MKKRPILCIDPSIVSTGFALFKSNDLFPAHHGLLRPNVKTALWHERAHWVADILLSSTKFFRPSVYCEMPQYFQSAVGHAAATLGSLSKLCYLIGAIGHACKTAGVPFHLVPVLDWKGQLPKEVVNRRIQKILKCSEKTFRADEWDAVGIGLWIKGAFK